jgi:hypothetical protein
LAFGVIYEISFPIEGMREGERGKVKKEKRKEESQKVKRGDRKKEVGCNKEKQNEVILEIRVGERPTKIVRSMDRMDEKVKVRKRGGETPLQINNNKQ